MALNHSRKQMSNLIYGGFMKKTCTQCRLEKDHEEFSKRSKSKDGRHVWCRSCCSAYRRGKGYDKYVNRQDYYREYASEYRKRESNKRYEEVFRRKYKGSLRGTVTSLMTAAKTRAKDKNIEFSLKREWIERNLEPMVCQATRSPLTLEIDKTVQHSPFRPSIERVDNSKGYTEDNCLIVCVIYNKCKSDCHHNDVLKMASYLIKGKYNE